jgi:hypothetical protein
MVKNICVVFVSSHDMPISYANMSEYMQEMTILTPYLLTKFHDFSVYLISGTWRSIWSFLRDLKGKIIKARVTMGVH